LSELGVDIIEHESRWSGRLGQDTATTIGNAGFAIAHRVCDLVRSYKVSGSLFQRWMLSHFPTLEFAARKPRVLDVDDAIWQDSGPATTRWLASRCAGVICGNSFLASRFSEWNSNIAVIPTAVDTSRFLPGNPHAAHGPQIICWSGSASTLRYLYEIERALARALHCNPQAKLRVMCNVPPTFAQIPASRTEYLEWSIGQEVGAIQGCTVGIMPLEDSEWARGKCSFKMLCYMACGIPVVVSPIGTNSEVLALGEVGLAAKSENDWVNALDFILKHPNKGGEMGRKGRALVDAHYSVRAVTPRLAEALRRFTDFA